MNEHLHRDFAACDRWDGAGLPDGDALDIAELADAVWHPTAAEPPPPNTAVVMEIALPDGCRYLRGYLDAGGDWRTHDQAYLYWYDPEWLPERWALLPAAALRAFNFGTIG